MNVFTKGAVSVAVFCTLAAAAMKPSPSHAQLFPVGPVQETRIARPQQPQHIGPVYSVCIGNGFCSSPVNPQYTRDCNFAAAHPNDTDHAAAAEICSTKWTPSLQIMWPPVPVSVTRVSSQSGGQCGTIGVTFSCAFQRNYSVCIGQYPGSCPGFGINNPLDQTFDCGFAASHASNTDQAAATQLCQSKGWAGGTAVRTHSYSGNQCGYIIDSVTCN
ncbi:MAG: hypothetical protein JOZ72_06100 [Alphaproteobacteria bacterium]|nr:hypothetical protein [Alphaproteobacteria bacterium]